MSYDGTKVPYDSDLHKKVSDALRRRIEMGKNALRERASKWSDIEDWFRAYLAVSESDRLKQEQRDKEGKPTYVTLDIPYSYATVLTAHTYIASTLLGRDPVLQVQGRHGEAQNQEQALEALLGYQFTAGQMSVPLYIWTLDACKYGLGVLGQYWSEEMRTVGKWVEQPKTFLGVTVPGKKERVYEEQEMAIYKGNKVFNVRPQDWIPDPRVTVTEFQKGEFCGRYCQLSMLDIVSNKEDYINVDALKTNFRPTGASNMRVQGSPRVDLPNTNSGTVDYTLLNDEYTTGVCEGYEMVVRLIPKEWGLGTSTKASKWIFLVMTGSYIVISAKPLGSVHDQFPYDILEGEIDGHSRSSRSMLEVMKPLNDTLTWLFNSHFYNVRKSLNDQFVVDPSRIVTKDLQAPGPGRMIRMKPAAYGQDVRTMLNQLQVQDVTRSHLQDAELVLDMLQRVSGVNDNLMGMVNSGRRSATEVRSSTTFGMNRMKTLTEYWSAQGFSPFTQKLIQNTQQFYDTPETFRIVGDLANNGTSMYAEVRPEDIAGFYDFTPVDGSMPIDRFAQVNLWGTLMTQVSQFPQIMQQYDFGKIFAFVAQLAGLKNITQFKVQVVPDAGLAAGMGAGNVIPIGGANPPLPPGAGMNVSPGAGPIDPSAAIPPAQVPGMGQSL